MARSTETLLKPTVQIAAPWPERSMPLDSPPAAEFPFWGSRIEVAGILAEHNPAGHVAINVCTPLHGVAISLAGVRGMLALGSGQLRRFASQPGGARFVPAQVAYRLVADASDCVLFAAAPDTWSQIAAESTDGRDVELYPCHVESDPVLLSLAQLTRQYFHNGQLGGTLYLESLATLVFVHAIQHSSNLQERFRALPLSVGSVPIKRAIDYIQANLHASLTLAEIARAAGLSLYHFARVFKRATGVPPHQFVLECRLERAKQMLTSSDLPIAQVAYAAGFASQSHLTALFQQLVGKTPRAYRQGS